MNIVKLKKGEKVPYELLMSADPSKSTIDEYIDRGTCYVMKDKDIIVGEFILLETDSEQMEVMNLAVDSKYMNRGNGRILVEKAIELAREEGMKILEISTRNSSIGQIALYQKCGFRIVGIEKDFYTNTYKEEIIENGIKCYDIIRFELKL